MLLPSLSSSGSSLGSRSGGGIGTQLWGAAVSHGAPSELRKLGALGAPAGELGGSRDGGRPTGMGPVWWAPNWEGHVMAGAQLGGSQYDGHPTWRVPVRLSPNWEGPIMVGTQLGWAQYDGHPTLMVPSWWAPNWDGPSMASTQLGGSQ